MAKADIEDDVVDIVNEQGERIGRAHRDECHSNPALLHQAVHVFVFNRQGELFLQKRSRHKRIQPDKWDTSVGGHVDLGEQPLTAACRETSEELGFTPQPEDLSFIHRYQWHSPIESELIVSYRIVFEGPFQLSPDEIDDGQFFSFDKIAQLATQGTITPNLAHELRMLGWLQP